MGVLGTAMSCRDEGLTARGRCRGGHRPDRLTQESSVQFDSLTDGIELRHRSGEGLDVVVAFEARYIKRDGIDLP